MMDEDDSFSGVIKHLRGVAPGLADHLLQVSPGTPSGAADETFVIESQVSPPRLADFKVLREIGKGGSGLVWLARNCVDQQLYAVKTVRSENEFELVAIREYKKRVKHHPNLVTILHAGLSEDDTLYYVMPLADDINSTASIVETSSYRPLTLAAFIDQHGRIDSRDALSIVKQLLSGLSHLHSNGAAHRDVKPSNILRVSGTWCLADPGLLTVCGADVKSAGTRGFFDTGATHAKANDLYAMGKTLFMMVTGQSLRGYDQFAREQPTGPEIDQRLRRAVQTACHEDHDERFQTVEDFHAAIETKNPTSKFYLAFATCLACCALATVVFLRSGTPQVEVTQMRVVAIADGLEFHVGKESNIVPLEYAYRVEAAFSTDCYAALFCREPDGNAYEIYPYDKPTRKRRQLTEPAEDQGFRVEQVGSFVVLLTTSVEPISTIEKKQIERKLSTLRPFETSGSWSYINGDLTLGSNAASRQNRPEPTAFPHRKELNSVATQLKQCLGTDEFSFIVFESK